MGVKIYEVGGSIRDEYLSNIRGINYSSGDVDYAVEAPSYEAMLNHIRDVLGYKVYLETPEYVTIRASDSKGRGVDYTLCRKEGPYSDGRHPDWVSVGTIQDDLARRDATMNAIARDVLTGEVLDPFNGLRDIELGVISPVGNVEDRVTEDPLRLLRYMRLSITKEMRLDGSIDNYIEDLWPLLLTISSDRIRDELTKMLKHNTVSAIQLLMSFIGEDGLREVLDKSGIWFMPTTKK